MYHRIVLRTEPNQCYAFRVPGHRFTVVSPETSSHFGLSLVELDSLLCDASDVVESFLGPFDPIDIAVTVAERGGGGANPGSMTISSVRYPGGLSLRESIFWLAVHELTHVLTYEWGDSQLPLIMEAIAYYVGGGFTAKAFDTDIHHLASYVLEVQPQLPRLVELLSPEQVFEMKNVFGAIATTMGSFAGFVLERHGPAGIRAAYTPSVSAVPHTFDSQAAAREAAESFYDSYANALGYPAFRSLENAWRDWLPVTNTKPSPLLNEYINELTAPREYPFVHCWKCWRPNERDAERCSHCSAPLSCDGP